MLFLFLFLPALAAPDPAIAEEVVVYADPLAPWDDTRWLVKLETMSTEERLSIQGENGQVGSWLWQTRAVLHCEVLERRKQGGLVACSPERVALAVVTTDQWQRKSDREVVDQVVDDVRKTMLQGQVRLRVRDHGAAHVLHNPAQLGDTSIGTHLLQRVFDGFQLDLPEEGFRDGVQWVSDDEPLLRLRAGLESFGAEEVVHTGSAYRGTQLIQTLGRARKSTVVGHTGRKGAQPTREGRFRASYDANQEMKIPLPEEILIQRTLQLEAVAILDRELGYVTERVWTVSGSGIVLERMGRLQLLGDTDQPDLGFSGQVSPPGDPRPHLPAWQPLEAAQVADSGQ